MTMATPIRFRRLRLWFRRFRDSRSNVIRAKVPDDDRSSIRQFRRIMGRVS